MASARRCTRSWSTSPGRSPPRAGSRSNRTWPRRSTYICRCCAQEVPAFMPHLSTLVPSNATVSYPDYLAFKHWRILDRCTHMLLPLPRWQDSNGSIERVPVRAADHWRPGPGQDLLLARRTVQDAAILTPRSSTRSRTSTSNPAVNRIADPCTRSHALPPARRQADGLGEARPVPDGAQTSGRGHPPALRGHGVPRVRGTTKREPIPIGIERKALKDFVSSVLSGRLAGHPAVWAPQFVPGDVDRDRGGLAGPRVDRTCAESWPGRSRDRGKSTRKKSSGSTSRNQHGSRA